MVDRSWQLVLSEILCFEDAHALMQLRQRATAAGRVLTANGVPIDELTAPVLPTDRAVAEALTQEMIELTCDDGWSYAHFTSWSSGVEVSDDEIASFRRRCGDRGVLLEP
jgi:hypothetical protein